MKKATGSIKLERIANGRLPALERIGSFAEFRTPLPEAERLEQAARCMSCGVPFCQSGERFGGMYSGCPLHNLIPEWNGEIVGGRFDRALERLLKTNNFPEFTGRVCPALCEAACICGLNGSPVTSHDNELSIIEYGFDNGLMQPRIPSTRSGKRVAVVGSGPAGLAVADQLNHRGHSVIVFERDRRPGGLLMYGIPNMKLDKKIVERRIKLMESEGVVFRTNANVGVTVSAKELSEEFDAVVLCCGSKTPRDLRVPGRDAGGVHFAVDYLTASTKAVLGETEKPSIDAEGKRVIIVGGGDTGNDCVGTAIRQGCKSVTQLELLPKLPELRAESNPWPEWPRVCKTDYGQEEAIAVFGEDPRRYRTTVSEIVKGEDGSVRVVRTVKLRSRRTETGETVMEEILGSIETHPCELLLIAAGFIGCESYVSDAFGVERTKRGCIATESEHCRTSAAKVFAAGDARIGQSLVVRAIAEGRACAAEVDEYLTGRC